jgi:hypothetical protein
VVKGVGLGAQKGRQRVDGSIGLRGRVRESERIQVYGLRGRVRELESIQVYGLRGRIRGSEREARR